MFGRYGEPWEWRAADPVEMNGGHGLKADMYTAINRCAGWIEDADYGKGLVAMRRTQGRHAVRERDALARAIAELASHLTAQNGLEYPGESAACSKSERSGVGVAVVREVIWRGADDRKTAVAVAKRDWHAPGDCGVLG